MIPVFQADNTRNALLYNGYTFNQVIGGSLKDIIEVNNVIIQTPIQAIHEPREFADGLESYGAYKRAKRIIMRGIVRASSRGQLYDLLEDFAAAVDPATVSRDNPTTWGFLPLDFNVPTADGANFPTGLLPSRYYCRAEQAFEPSADTDEEYTRRFTLPFLAPDPRRYRQTASTLSGSGTADNSIGNFYSWPTLTIAMTGAGSATFSIANAATGDTLVLNLSGRANGETVTVDMERKKISVAGVELPAIYVSGTYFTIKPGSNAITVTNSTAATATLTWRSAFSF